MSARTDASSSGKLLSLFSSLPWTFLIIAFLVFTTVSKVDMNGWVGYLFIGLGMFVIFVEFFKSGDIRTSVFLVDLISSVIAVVAGSILMTLLYVGVGVEPGVQPTFFHWYGCVVLVADSILSPYNAFRTAKRNFEVGT